MFNSIKHHHGIIILQIAHNICNLVVPYEKISKSNKIDSVVADPTYDNLSSFINIFKDNIIKLSLEIRGNLNYYLENIINQKPISQNDKKIMFNQAQILVTNLREALIILEEFSANTGFLTDTWTEIRTHENGTKFTLRGQLFFELYKIRILILFLSASNIKHLLHLKYPGSPTVSNFPLTTKFNISLIKYGNHFFHDESKSMWMRVAYFFKDVFQAEDVSTHEVFKPTTTTKKKSNTLHEKKILLYSISDLEEAFKMILFRWKLIDFCDDIPGYVNLLLDRMALIIFFQSNCEHVGTNVDEQMHINKEMLEETNRQKKNSTIINKKEPFLNIYLDETQYTKTKSEVKTLSDSKLTFDYLYRSELRYHVLTYKLNKLSLRRKLNKEIISDTNNYLELASFFETYIKKWATSAHAEYYEDKMNKRHLDLLIPPGDDRWVNFFYPYDHTSTPDGIIKKLYKDLYQTKTKEAITKISDIIKKRSVSNIKFHDELVMIGIEPTFSDTIVGSNKKFSFQERFFKNENDEENLFSSEYVYSQKPFLAIFFSRIMVHTFYKKPIISISTDIPLTVQKRVILEVYNEDATIYHAIARLLIILQKKHQHSTITKFLWEKVAIEQKNLINITT